MKTIAQSIQAAYLHAKTFAALRDVVVNALSNRETDRSKQLVYLFRVSAGVFKLNTRYIRVLCDRVSLDRVLVKVKVKKFPKLMQ